MGDIESMIDEKQLARMEAIVLSMTPQERRNPKLLNPSRKHVSHGGAGGGHQRSQSIYQAVLSRVRKMMKQFPGMLGGKGARKGKFRLPF